MIQDHRHREPDPTRDAFLDKITIKKVLEARAKNLKPFPEPLMEVRTGCGIFTQPPMKREFGWEENMQSYDVPTVK